MPPAHVLPEATTRVRVWRALSTALIALVALWTRSTWRSVVFVDGETLPLDTDSHHHMRRALETLARFPHVPARDPWIDWPRGAFAPWGPGFDQLLALPAWLLGARGDPARAARIIAWVPPVLGAIVAVMAMSIARRIEPDRERREPAALLAGIITAALPTATLTALVGRTDHHVFEAFATALVALWALSAPPPSPRAWRFELWGALVVFVVVHGFSGAVMQCALAGAALALRLAFEDAPPPRERLHALAGTGGPALCGGALALVLIDGPWIRAHDAPFHHLQLSYLQPLLLAIAGVSLTTLAAVTRWRVWNAPRWRAAVTRVAVAVGLLAPVAVAIQLLLPSVRDEFAAGMIDWLATRDPWMASVVESFPLLRGGTRRARDVFGLLAFATPVLLPLAVRRAARVRIEAALTLALVGGGLLGLALLQNRFCRALPALFGAWTALGLFELLSLVARRVKALTPSRVTAAAFALTLLWIVADPDARETFVPVRGHWMLGVHEAALYLRARAPVARGHRDAVLAHWTMGHEVMWLSRRPVVVAGFGPYTSREAWDDAESAWRGDEARALAVMDRHDAGYMMFPSAAVLDPPSPTGRRSVKRSARGGFALDGAYLREVPIAAAVLGGSGSVSFGVAHFEHLRPVFADGTRIAGLTSPVPGVWVYERVRGATLRGHAPDGTRVVLHLPMRVRDFERRWEAWTDARGGQWSATVPLPTGWNSGGGIATGPRYEVTAGVVRVSVSVSEGEVRDGAVVDVPAAR